MDILKRKTFLVVTGGSKGLGSCIAHRFSKHMPEGSIIVLIARSKDGLEATKEKIQKDASHVQVNMLAADLSKLDDVHLYKCLKDTLDHYNVTPGDFEQALVVHNAASMGDVSKTFTQIHETQFLRSYWDLNLTSVIGLNWAFFKVFSQKSIKHRVVINISSICALQPFKSWSLYCSGKAARDMLFRTMALEDPSIRVLNYAPGPLDTEMQVVARRDTGDKELKNLFTDMHGEGRLLSCDQSVEKLEALLAENTFDSGSHIDYYDL